ncbi:MAG: HAD-IB family phosphatase [Gemmatimonadaceae bacterium]
MTRQPRFRSVVLDVDSTLSGVEGVDWLAQLRGPEVAQRSAQLTERAMNGELPIDAIYGERLALIRPSRAEVDALSRIYQERLAAGAESTIGEMRRARVRVVLVSGGFRPAIEPLAGRLGVELHAVDLLWNPAGEYAGFDTGSPLATQKGKLEVVRGLSLPRAILAVGDGSTDLGMRPVVDRFVAFTGFARRDAVVEAADGEIDTYAQLAALVFSDSPREK